VADVKLIFVNSDAELQEIGSSDIALVDGIKTTGAILTFEDTTNGTVSLSDLLNDRFVRVSNTDAVSDFLENKLTFGTGFSTNITTDSAGSETLEISVDFSNVSIDDLNDVDTTTDLPNEDDVLAWNGYEWVPTDPEDLPDVNTYSFNGGVINVAKDDTKGADWGRSSINAGVTILEDGEIRGMSVALNFPRSNGTLTVMLVINGVAQNAVGQTFSIDSGHPINHQLVLASPISVSQGDVVTIQTVTSSFAPVTADATVSFWGRNI